MIDLINIIIAISLSISLIATILSLYLRNYVKTGKDVYKIPILGRFIYYESDLTFIREVLFYLSLPVLNAIVAIAMVFISVVSFIVDLVE